MWNWAVLPLPWASVSPSETRQASVQVSSMDSDKLNIPGPHIHLFSRHLLNSGYHLSLCQVMRTQLWTNVDLIPTFRRWLSQIPLWNKFLFPLLFLDELFIGHVYIRHGPGGPGRQSRVCYEASLQGAQSSRRTSVRIQFTTSKVESVQRLAEI